jgi:hypothetical protein
LGIFFKVRYKRLGGGHMVCARAWRCSKSLSFAGRAHRKSADPYSVVLIDTFAAARNLGCQNEIADVLVRHGFGGTVRCLGLATIEHARTGTVTMQALSPA